MKNKFIKSVAAISVVAVLAFLPGCDNGDEISKTEITGSTESDTAEDKIEKKPVSVVRDTLDEEIEALRTEKFDNISFENLKTYSFPDVSEITTTPKSLFNQ